MTRKVVEEQSAFPAVVVHSSEAAEQPCHIARTCLPSLGLQPRPAFVAGGPIRLVFDIHGCPSWQVGAFTNRSYAAIPYLSRDLQRQVLRVEVLACQLGSATNSGTVVRI